METLKISLIAARVNAGLTQNEVAHIMRVSKNKIINWEKGRAEIKPQEIGYLAQLYGIAEDNISLPINTTLS